LDIQRLLGGFAALCAMRGRRGYRSEGVAKSRPGDICAQPVSAAFQSRPRLVRVGPIAEASPDQSARAIRAIGHGDNTCDHVCEEPVMAPSKLGCLRPSEAFEPAAAQSIA
jgi:hypothetical protein